MFNILKDNVANMITWWTPFYKRFTDKIYIYGSILLAYNFTFLLSASRPVSPQGHM